MNQIPYFPLVAEHNIRRGFLTDEQYEKLRDELPDELKALFVTAYITGMRRSELISIRWPQVDFEAGFIVLQTGETKNGDGRGAPIDGKHCELHEYDFQENRWLPREEARWRLPRGLADQWLTGWNHLDRFAAVSVLTNPAEPVNPRPVPARLAEPGF